MNPIEYLGELTRQHTLRQHQYKENWKASLWGDEEYKQDLFTLEVYSME